MKGSLILGLLAAFLLGPVTGGVAYGAGAPALPDKPDQAVALAASADHPYHFGFKKSVGGQLPSIDQEGFKEIVDKHGAVFLADTTRKDLFLTFDNGYENGYTAPILDTLKTKKVPAVFFITGHYVKDQPELVRRMAAEGHLVGNHSWSHPDMTTISDSQIKEELDRVKEASAKLTGTERMAYLRPPRGIFSDRVLRVTKELGYTNVFWSVAYKDWDVNDQKGAPYAYRKVIDQLHPGAVILLHSVSKDNAAALGAIIDEARRQGYEFRSLDELMRSRSEKQPSAAPGQPTN
ncbi:delta-lactam-biosynthetic de-N-acetylase [Paenibacillus sanfengchensis]|uniref:delta-lactam-biosynthetic de-N-acetylase n=1 Tax=Paenibacillus sanfengchensis TaxID=3119819 RepID=UPI002FDF3B70